MAFPTTRFSISAFLSLRNQDLTKKPINIFSEKDSPIDFSSKPSKYTKEEAKDLLNKLTKYKQAIENSGSIEEAYDALPDEIKGYLQWAVWYHLGADPYAGWDFGSKALERNHHILMEIFNEGRQPLLSQLISYFDSVIVEHAAFNLNERDQRLQVQNLALPVRTQVVFLRKKQLLLVRDSINRPDEFRKHFENLDPLLQSYLAEAVYIAYGLETNDANFGTKKILETPELLVNVKNADGLELIQQLIDFYDIRKRFSDCSNAIVLEAAQRISTPTDQDSFEIPLDPAIRDQQLEKAKKTLEFLNQVGDQGFTPEQLETLKRDYQEVYFYLSKLVWIVCGQPDIDDFGGRQLEKDPTLLLRIRDSEGKHILDQLKTHFEMQTHFIPAINDLLLLRNHYLSNYGNSEAVKGILVKQRHELIKLLIFMPLKEILDANPPRSYQAGAKERGLNAIDKALKVLDEGFMRSDLNDSLEDLERVAPGETQMNVDPTAIECDLDPSKKLHIYMIAAECNNVVKVGGLAEAFAGMAEGFWEKGHTVTMIMPKYASFPSDRNGAVLRSMHNTAEKVHHVFAGDRKEDRVFEGRIGNLEVLFIDHNGANYPIEDGSCYANNDHENVDRFGYFGASVAQLMKERSQRDDHPHIVFHEWTGALALPLLREKEQEGWNACKIAPITYIFHNNGETAQGRLEAWNGGVELLQKVDLIEREENLARYAAMHADVVATVSETYALEAQGPEGKDIGHAYRLAASENRYYGIQNGSNVTVWNPETDATLVNWTNPKTGLPTPLNYGPEGRDGKSIVDVKYDIAQNLQDWIEVYHHELIENYGLNVTTGKVLFFIGRYATSQKGLEAFKAAIQEAKEQGATLITVSDTWDDTALPILEECEQMAREMKDPSWGGAWIVKDEKIQGRRKIQQGEVGDGDEIPGVGSLIRAVATHNFIPSIYEPCGLTDIEGFLFGGLAIAREVGGLKDKNVSDPDVEGFNGFPIPVREWYSDEQHEAIRGAIRKNLEFWDRLEAHQKAKYMGDLMRMWRKASWTQTPDDSPSPIARYEKVLALAEENAHKRGKAFEVDANLLKA